MESFEELATQYEPMIHKILMDLHIYKNKEEFIQLGLISLWEAWENFNPDKGNFTNYAYSSIKGKFLSAMTKENIHGERFVHPQEEFWESIEDPSDEQHSDMDTILSLCRTFKLTPNQIKWVQYTLNHDLSIAEIAEKEKVSPSAVKAWRKGAKEKLRSHFKQSN